MRPVYHSSYILIPVYLAEATYSSLTIASGPPVARVFSPLLIRAGSVTSNTAPEYDTGTNMAAPGPVQDRSLPPASPSPHSSPPLYRQVSLPSSLVLASP